MSLDITFGGTLRIPLIVAPMFLVSTPEMALAVSSEGAMGSFPAHSTRTPEIFQQWVLQMKTGIAGMEKPGPWAVNLVVHESNKRMKGDLEVCIRHKVPVILTSKGAPNDVFQQIHDYGGVILHDVASVRHAEKALEAGADGLIAVCGGAGGHTGRVNPFALLNEIRAITDKPVVLSGALSTGRDILAAQAMGADLAYMGTRFINSKESAANDEYRNMIENCTAKDVFFTAALDGAPANFLTPSLLNMGIDLDELAATKPGKIIADNAAKQRFSRIFSAGHGVGMVKGIVPAVETVRNIIAEYGAAKTDFSRQIL